MKLKVATCTHDAARFACERWHYTRLMPPSKVVRHGVWEDGEFIGAVVYGTGNIMVGKAFGVLRRQACELVRVALRSHRSPVTQIVSESLSLLKEYNPGLRIVVSYADPHQGHLGIIYQAGNWSYMGWRKSQTFIVNGERVHPRTCGDRWGTCSIPKLRELVDPKARRVALLRFKYAMPLDRAMRRQLAKKQEGYPKQLALEA